VKKTKISRTVIDHINNSNTTKTRQRDPKFVLLPFNGKGSSVFSTSI